MSNEIKIPDGKELKIKIDDGVLPGKYANQIIIMHSKDEFILDFVTFLPPGPNVVSRVIMTPGHFKRILAGMNDNLQKYERNFGEISIANDPVVPSEGGKSIH